MKKLLLATVASAAMATAVSADDVKIGVFLGFTGPIESLVAQMGPGAEAAIAEVSASGSFMNGSTVTAIRADTTCVDAGAATAAAERLITSDKVSGIVGGDCSGVTTATLTNVAMPNGMVMISPSATSPALSTIEDNGLFFRTAPSDARQGVVMSEIIMERGYNSVALTYTNNDYGKGLADAFAAAFEAAGGEDQGGKGIIQASLDTGAFDTFVLPDGMVGDSLPEAIGTDLDGSFGQAPGTDSEGAATLVSIAGDSFDATSPFAAESYDAAALILLAMQAAGSKNPADYKGKVFDVANAPGEQILPGELAKGMEILASGGEIDYVGASNVELIGAGESAGNYREITIKDAKISVDRYR